MGRNDSDLADKLSRRTNAELESAVRAQLSDVGTRRAQAVKARDEASAQLRPLVRKAAAQGLSIAEIARVARLSRPAVYDFLEK